MHQNTPGMDMDAIFSELCGHRPVVFSDAGEEDAPLSTEEMDVFLVRDNGIVASTAKAGRYAAGQLFYRRSPRLYDDLLRACAQVTGNAPMFLAFAHNRSIVLVSGALLSDTDLVVAIALHGNVKRTRRVLEHCFADVVTWCVEVSPQGGLRRGDEDVYHRLGRAVRLFRRLFFGCGGCVEITERGRLITLLQRQMSEILCLLPDVVWIGGEEDPTDIHYPCLGTVNVCHAVAVLLCFLLGVGGCFAGCTLRMTASEEDMYPRFILTATERIDGVPRLDRHPAIVEGMRLSLRGATQFECIAADGRTDVWQIRLSPMRAYYGEMYTLRSAAISEEA